MSGLISPDDLSSPDHQQRINHFCSAVGVSTYHSVKFMIPQVLSLFVGCRLDCPACYIVHVDKACVSATVRYDQWDVEVESRVVAFYLSKVIDEEKCQPQSILLKRLKSKPN